MSGLLKFFGMGFALVGCVAAAYCLVNGLRASFGGNLLFIAGAASLFSGAAFGVLFHGVAEVLERLPEKPIKT